MIDFDAHPVFKLAACHTAEVEAAGVVDRDTQAELWFAGLGKVHFEFKSNFDVALLNRIISAAVL